jgi:hypothetical protein
MNRVDAAPAAASSDEIRDNIRRTRAAMDETLAALSAKIHPRTLLDDAIDSFANADGENGVSDMGHRLLESIKTNPIPLGLIATGITWMVLSGSKNDGVDDRDWSAEGEEGLQRARYPERHRWSPSAPVADLDWERRRALEEKLDGEDTDGSRWNRMARAPRNAVRGVGRGLQRGGHTISNGIDEHPLSIGLTALSLGLIAGMFIPASSKEDSLLGRHSDRLIDSAKHAGKDLVEDSKSALRAGADAAERRLREEELTRSGLTERTKHVVRDAVDAAGEEFRDRRS